MNVKKWKYPLALFLGISAFLTSAWYYQFFPFKKIPYLCIPLQFTEDNIPYTQVEIGGMRCTLILDTGAGSEFGLRKELLDKVSKQFSKKVEWLNIKGDVYETQDYLVPKIKIQTSWIKDVIIREEIYSPPPLNESMWIFSQKLYEKNGNQIDGRIGWKFLTSFYPFFDIGNSVFYFTRGPSSLHKLEEKGYSISDLYNVPFEMNGFGCVFTVDTDLGKKRFLFDTGCTYSMINSSVVNPQNMTIVTPEKKITTLNNVSIGNYFLGKMDFHLIDFGPPFDEIDGIIGMDFFSKNIVYLNFKEEKALLGPSRPLKI
jgi:predicted aspartyl protease